MCIEIFTTGKTSPPTFYSRFTRRANNKKYAHAVTITIKKYYARGTKTKWIIKFYALHFFRPACTLQHYYCIQPRYIATSPVKRSAAGVGVGTRREKSKNSTGGVWFFAWGPLKIARPPRAIVSRVRRDPRARARSRDRHNNNKNNVSTAPMHMVRALRAEAVRSVGPAEYAATYFHVYLLFLKRSRRSPVRYNFRATSRGIFT